MTFYSLRPESILVPYVTNPVAVFTYYQFLKQCQDNFNLRTFLLNKQNSIDNLTIFLLQQLKVQVLFLYSFLKSSFSKL